MLTHDPNDTKPCWHMRTLVSALADNQLVGILLRFTELHLKGCPQCQHGLATLLALRDRLRGLGGSRQDIPPLPASRWTQVEAAWERADRVRE